MALVVSGLNVVVVDLVVVSGLVLLSSARRCCCCRHQQAGVVVVDVVVVVVVRPYVINLLPCLASVCQREEEAVQETLAGVVQKICPILATFATDTEAKVRVANSAKRTPRKY